MFCVDAQQVCRRSRAIWDECFGKPRLSGKSKRRAHLHKGARQPGKAKPTSETTWIRKRRADVAAGALQIAKRPRTETLASASAKCSTIPDASHAMRSAKLSVKRNIRQALALESGSLLESEACSSVVLVRCRSFRPASG